MAYHAGWLQLVSGGRLQARGLGVLLVFTNLASSGSPCLCFFAIMQHEFGHGCAAYGDNVPVNGFGVLVLAFFVPGAFVRLCSTLQLQSTFSQLRVYFAGVWNNMVSTITPCLLILLKCLHAVLRFLHLSCSSSSAHVSLPSAHGMRMHL